MAGEVVVPNRGPKGDKGDQGDPGGPPGPRGPSGQPRWSGNGPPPQVIEGAEPGDVYVDLLTGTTYELV